MKNRKLTRFFVEPGDTFTDQALRQSDCLSEEPNKTIRRSDGTHRLLQCQDKGSAQFLRSASDDDSRFKMTFWAQEGNNSPRRCQIEPINFNEPVFEAV